MTQNILPTIEQNDISKILLPANDEGLAEINPESGLPPSKPIVLINIKDDDPNRGDTAGRIGLGRMIADKLGGISVYADEKLLNGLYPEMAKQPYNNKLSRLISEKGTPDIIMGFQCRTVLKDHGRDSRDVRTYSEYNETLSSNLLNEDELVSHHLRPEILEEAGAEFEKEYPDIKKPLITILYADNPFISDSDEFNTRIAKIASHYPEATIFLCGGRSTLPERQKEAAKNLETILDNIGCSDKIRVVNWTFSREGYNPYKGLIAKSDHFIVQGNSQSLLSEPLVRGRTVYLYHGSRCSQLEEKGYVVPLMKCFPDEPFPTKTFEPIDLTERLADKIANDFNTASLERADDIKTSLDVREVPEEWRTMLTELRFHPETLKNIPDDIKYSPEFLSAALMVNSTCHIHIDTKKITNLETAKILVSYDTGRFKDLPKKLRGNKQLLKSLDTPLGDIFAHVPKRLRSDRPFIKTIIADHPDIYPYLSSKLKDDLKLAQKAISKDSWMSFRYIYNNCSEKVANNITLARKTLDINSEYYRYLPRPIQENEILATKAITDSAWEFSHAPPKIKAHKNIAALAIKDYARLFNYIDKSLFQDIEFMTEVLIDNPQIVYEDAFERYCSDNEPLMRALIQKIPTIYSSASLRLRNDPDFTETAIDTGYGMAVFEDCGPDIPKNRKLALKCVKADPESYAHFHTSIREQKDIAKIALKGAPHMIAHLPESIEDDKSLARTALKSDRISLSWLSYNLQNDETFISEAIKINSYYYASAIPEIRKLPHIAQQAVDANISNLLHVPKTRLLQSDFISYLHENHKEALIKEDATHNEAFWIKMLTTFDDMSFADLPKDLKHTKTFVLKLAEVLPEILKDPEVEALLSEKPTPSLFAANDNTLQPEKNDLIVFDEFDTKYQELEITEHLEPDSFYHKPILNEGHLGAFSPVGINSNMGANFNFTTGFDKPSKKPSLLGSAFNKAANDAETEQSNTFAIPTLS